MDAGKPLEPLGERIRRIRQEKGIGQDRLAIEARIDQSGLSKFERGRQRFGPVPLGRIAKVLGVSLEDLVAGTDFKA